MACCRCSQWVCAGFHIADDVRHQRAAADAAAAGCRRRVDERRTEARQAGSLFAWPSARLSFYCTPPYLY